MKSRGITAGISAFLFFLIGSTVLTAQEGFREYFTESSIRVDLVLAGDHQQSEIYLDEIRREAHWGGPRIPGKDPFDYGEYKFELWDEITGKLIYSKGFCTLFEEWQTTPEAHKIRRAFDQVIVFPEPRRVAMLKIHERDSLNVFQEKFLLRLDPADPVIGKNMNTDFPVLKLFDHGEAKRSLDIAFLAEGYTASQTEKFYADVRLFSNYMFEFEPFSHRKSSINVWAVAAVSDEQGADQPGKSIWLNTAMDANYYTFGSERYLTTESIKTVRDIAGQVPYDVICILVNSDKYGGGGIYNHYAVSSSEGAEAKAVMMHELAHALVGLGDEYYTSDVAYEGFYRLDLEPWQANLTTLIDFESKWRAQVYDSLPVPTPCNETFSGITGVFEGGGYLANGIYRPELDCRMKSNTADGFCSVCRAAINEMIDYYCGKDNNNFPP